MKKLTLIFAIVFLLGNIANSQTQLTWRFARPQVIAGTPDIFQFDVQVKADAAGTFQRDLQVYFDYNTAAFGTDIFANGKVQVQNLLLMNTYYTQVNTADNTSSTLAVITEAINEMTDPGSSTKFNEMPIDFIGLLRFKIEIADNSQLAGITFNETLMNGGQYEQSIANTDPIAYQDPCLYENSLSNSSLKGMLFSSLKCFMEGPYDATTGSVMNTDLLDGGYLPTSQPFNPPLPYYGNSAPVWLYAGTETVSSFPANTVDWVLVQLRDATDVSNAGSGSIVSTTPAFLLNDGSIVELDGNPLIIKAAYNFNLYVIIYQRNHLGVISNNVVQAGSTGVYSYDFSSGENQVFGSSNGHKDLGGGVWGLISSDGNGSGNIAIDDKNDAWLPYLNATGYNGGDFDLNGTVEISEKNTLWVGNLNNNGQIPAKGTIVNGYTSQIPK
jgi:hypothetical protein